MARASGPSAISPFRDGACRMSNVQKGDPNCPPTPTPRFPPQLCPLDLPSFAPFTAVLPLSQSERSSVSYHKRENNSKSSKQSS